MPGARLLLALVAAFAGIAVAGCMPDNQGACEDYVQRVNIARAQCAQDLDPLDAEVVCPAELNGLGADCTDYYDSLAARVYCDADNNYVVGQVQGSDPNGPPTAPPPGCT